MSTAVSYVLLTALLLDYAPAEVYIIYAAATEDHLY
jgi:hypothetical protein